MRDVFKVLWESLIDTYGEIFQLVPLSLITVLLLVPVVTAPPALAGMWAVGNRVAKGERAEWRFYWLSFRAYFWSSWKLAAANVIVLTIIGANLWFYSPLVNPLRLSSSLIPWVLGAWGGLLIPWLLIAQHLVPLLLEQEDQRLRTTLRNAAVLLARRPGFCALILLFKILIGLASAMLVVPWLLITPAVLAILSNGAMLVLLTPDRERTESRQSSPR